MSEMQSESVSVDSGCNASVPPFGPYDTSDSVVLEITIVNINALPRPNRRVTVQILALSVVEN